MSQNDKERSGTFNIQGQTLWSKNFGFEPDASCNALFQPPAFDITITLHYFTARPRLVRIRPLMRRERGRKILGVRRYSYQITLYDMQVKA